jgi:hypothetical protein
MSHLRLIAILLAIVVGAVPTSAFAAEPVTVYTISPTLLAERASLERVINDYPKYKAKWESQRHITLTYTVTQKTVGLITPHDCEELPILVRVVDGRLAKATYATSGGRCRAGENVGRVRARANHQYLTPAEFFERVAEAKKQLKCYLIGGPPACMPTTLRVTYDDRFGFPVKMEDYSEAVADFYWSLEVSDIRVVP